MRNTEPSDIEDIIEVCELIYPDSAPYSHAQLISQQRTFPEGQLVAIDPLEDRLLGMASSLIVRWDDYDADCGWREFTEGGYFTNHDPVAGQTLYAAEVMVHPAAQGRGVGKAIYQARRQLCQRLGLKRIRGGGRLRGYWMWRNELSPQEYAIQLARGELHDPTLSFQLKQGFQIIGVVENYLFSDPESCGHAAIIEWLNPDRATEADYAHQDPKFHHWHTPDEEEEAD
ncbi:MAG: GNAT family N-acetyltransferase [Phycisphaerae bacterium]